MITLTEALAKIKTNSARIEKKVQFVNTNLVRSEKLRDPLEKDGVGAPEILRREMQAVNDLWDENVNLRRAIQSANENTVVTIGTTTRSIADWLVWRRDVAPGRKAMLNALWNTIQAARSQAQRQGLAVVPAGADPSASMSNIIVNVDERKLAGDIEDMEKILGELDGQLSLRNATVTLTL